MTTDTKMDKILSEYPTARIKSHVRFAGKNNQIVYHVVDENLFVLGRGKTEKEAWENVYDNLIASHP